MGRVAILHPDLGVGGAERLIVDAAKALQDSGHNVVIFAGYHNKDRCFEETRDGTLKVVSVCQWFPRTIFGRAHALMAYIKMILIAVFVILFHKHDIVICDQVSACTPILKLDFRNKSRIIFYCHFPDQLLTTRDSMLKSLYRIPIDYFEEQTTRLADVILVNSKFTSSIVRRTFESLKSRDLDVLYPCVDVNSFVKAKADKTICSESVKSCMKLAEDGTYMFMSLNRFERKKNLALAIHALSECVQGYEQQTGTRSMKAHLIMAGGYDERLNDSVLYYQELKRLVNELELGSHVTFVKSPSDDEKLILLQNSDCVLYTPENEHFGIVPLEAMAMSKPVIASATGGPLETIETEVTGLLCESDKFAFADAMLRLFSDRKLSNDMGKAGYARVLKHFSYAAFRNRLNKICFPVAV